jgi:hypothetical protein
MHQISCDEMMSFLVHSDGGVGELRAEGYAAAHLRHQADQPLQVEGGAHGPRRRAQGQGGRRPKTPVIDEGRWLELVGLGWLVRLRWLDWLELVT